MKFLIFIQLELVLAFRLISLPNDNILVLTKLKAFEDDKINAAQIISVSDRLENIVGKGENAGHQHFCLLTQYFQKASYTGTLEVLILW